VWLSIASGLGVLGLFMGSLTVANARVLNRRRRQAEELFQALLQAEDAERHRIVGALHDDVGQPLYRLLYGLQGCRARVEGASAVATELEQLEALVREVDGTLRAELSALHRGVTDEVGQSGERLPDRDRQGGQQDRQVRAPVGHHPPEQPRR
jgi:signal transduction histidine kinase